MRAVDVDTKMTEGCDERCSILRYRDPDNSASPLYLRRMHSAEAHNEHDPGGDGPLKQFSWDGLEADFVNMDVRVDGVRLDVQSGRRLTPREWDILRALVLRRGGVVSQSLLLQSVWGDAYMNDSHLLRVNMARIRKKLDPTKVDRFIETVAGVGYRFGKSEMAVLHDEQRRRNGVVVVS